MRGTTPEQAAYNRQRFQRSLASFAKHHKINQEDPTDPQMRAIEHLRNMDSMLWGTFKKHICKRIKVDQKGKFLECETHKEKMWCRKGFEDWLKGRNY